MTTRRTLEKQLSYRDWSGSSQAAHQAHWAGFTFTGGPVVVTLAGPWGRPTVWASSESEGRRVLQHAASIAGWDLGQDGVEWLVSTTSSNRLGRVASFGVQVKRGLLMVTKRDGSSGAPLE